MRGVMAPLPRRAEAPRRPGGRFILWHACLGCLVVLCLAQLAGRAADVAATYGLAAAAVAAAVLAARYGASKPGLQRAARFWWHVGPIFLRYWWAKRTARTEFDREKAYKRLHARHAPAARRIVEELQGMFVKIAQVVSVIPDLIPAEYQQEFRKLQHKTLPVCWPPIKEVLEQEFGKPVDAVFEHIAQAPLGSASFGQAHLATWRGRRVVVKVQYPDSAAHIRADWSGLLAGIGVTKPEVLPMLRQIGQQFETELDYTLENQHLRELRAALAAAPEFKDRVVLPEPVPELVSGRALGMEFLPGPPLVTVLEERLRALGIDVCERTVGALFGAGKGDAGSNGADAEGAMNGPLRHARALATLGAGLPLGVGLAEPPSDELLQRMREGPATGTQIQEATPGADVLTLLRLACDVQGYQLFFCPCFNGDPHPGNLLALPDGRLGLIDFGLCITCPRAVKAQFARLLLLLGSHAGSKHGDERIADAMLELGVRTEKGDCEYLAYLARFSLTRLRPEWFKDDFMRQMLRRDRVVEQPLALVFIGRTAQLLRGLGFLALENVDLAEVWRPWAERWLREDAEA